MRAAIYARKSKAPNNEGRSVAEQEAECRRVTDQHQWTLTKVYIDDDISASRYARTTRPAFTQLLNAIRSGQLDVLVTWEASRFQRDLTVYVELRDLCRAHNVGWCYNGRLYNLDDADDRFTTGLDALLAEREVEMTKARVSRALRANLDAGRPHGRIPWGYTRTKTVTPGSRTLAVQAEDPDIAHLIRQLAQDTLAGHSIYSLAKRLNNDGIPTPTGKGAWSPRQIKRVLTSPTYAGKRTHQGVVTSDGTWPAILDELTHYRLLALLTDSSRGTHHAEVRYLLTGIARCGVCDGPMTSLLNRQKYRAYVCRENYCVARKHAAVDAHVTGFLLGMLSTLDLAALSRDGDDAQAAIAEVNALQARLDAFYDEAADGALSPAALARVEAKLLPQIAAARDRVQPTGHTGVLAAFTDADIDAVWDALTMEQRRTVVSELLDVRILKHYRGGRTYAPATVEITPRLGGGDLVQTGR